MPFDQLNMIRRQAEAAVKNRAAGEISKIRRKTSLIGEVSRLTGRVNQRLDRALDRMGDERPAPELEDWDEDAQPSPAAPRTYADGYVRRSPEQPLYTPPDYRKRIWRRAAGVAAAVLFALAALWLLVHYGILSI